MKILALDPATHCGFAHSCGASGVWDLSVRRDESSGMRLIRLVSKLEEVRIIGIDLLVFEAARHGGPHMQGPLVVQAELQGVIKLWCERSGILYRGYSPTEIKKHATRSGRANKLEMTFAAAERWPQLNIIDHNHADALWLLSLASAEYDV